MRKQDIKPGVVYAFTDSSRYVKPRPVAFLDAGLWTGRDSRNTESPRFRRALPGESPHSGRLGSPSTGYLVAIMREKFGGKMDFDGVAARIGSVTLADAEAAGWEHLDDEISFMLVVRLGVIAGQWDEVTARLREHMPNPLAAPSSEPGREDFRTALARLIREHALDVTDGRHSAEEIATGMDEFRVKLARSSWQEHDA